MTAFQGPAIYFQHQPQSYINMGVDTNGNGYTDDDLIASLAGFAVEGQTERDLATIKAMLASSNNSNNNGFSNLQHRGAAVAAANGVAWPMQFQQQQQWQYANFGNPPPNTPTLSKSMELHNQQLDYGYPGSSGRRRDVSLDRSYNAPMQGGSSSALGMDMEMSIQEDEDDGVQQEDEMKQGSSTHWSSACSTSRHGMHARTPSLAMQEMYGETDDHNGSSSEQASAIHEPDARPSWLRSNGAVAPSTSSVNNSFTQSPPPLSRSNTPKHRQKSPPTVVHAVQTRSKTRNQANGIDERRGSNGST